MKDNFDSGEITGRSREERLESLFAMAEGYSKVGSREINPSLYELQQISLRYTSEELIAEGGMKQVYKVFDECAKRELAMATLRVDASDDLCDPFIHEAWLTAKLDHPNIIKIHDVGVNEATRPFFTMDLKKGDSLQSLLLKLNANKDQEQSQYPLESLLQMFLKVCDAIAYAHSVNVVHLDLKPANIQVGEYGQVLVCDWGLGQILGGGDPQEIVRILYSPELLGMMNLYGQLKGTPGYMAPEQLLEDSTSDERTDVYGLGSILYALLTLEPPIDGDKVNIVESTKRGNVIAPIQRCPERHISKSLNAVVMKAMALHPANRYLSVDDLRSDVLRYLTGFATEAENAGLFKQMKFFYRRNRQFCRTVFCSTLLLVIATSLAFIKISEAKKDAEYTLALYEAGKGELERMSFQNSESIAKIAMRYHLSDGFERAEAILRAALEKDPSNKLFNREMGIHYFIVQE
jgi:serine/threonine-protein kinase